MKMLACAFVGRAHGFWGFGGDSSAPKQTVAPEMLPVQPEQLVNDEFPEEQSNEGRIYSTSNSSSTSSHSLGKPESSVCRGHQEEFKVCQKDECAPEECIDCIWAEWSEYSPCDCDGLKERHRVIALKNTSCGKPCEGPRVEAASCPVACEKKPVNCMLGDWTEWGKCDKKCDRGQQIRTREIAQEPANNGHVCEDSLEETRECNAQSCNSPVDCVVSLWGEWGECSRTCDGGQRERKRDIKTPAAFNGKPCEASLKEVEGCNDEPCQSERDCQWRNWDEWGACSNSCDGGVKKRARVIEVAPAHGGKPCDPKVMEEVSPCNMEKCNKPVDCEISEWSEWGQCSSKCNGYASRTRTVIADSAYEGKPCDGGVHEITSCNVEACGDEKEETKEPQDCELETFGEWGACSQTCGNGIRRRARSVEHEAVNGGKSCNDSTQEVQGCKEAECPELEEDSYVQDCILSEWGDWDDCSATCGPGLNKRQRNVKQNASLEGQRCGQETIVEVAKCEKQKCESEDCQWGPWGEWGTCPCMGLRERSRHIVSQKKGDGKECIGAKSEKGVCLPECTKPSLDCLFGEWGEWDKCSEPCGGGQQKRSREIEVQPERRGKPCSGPLDETRLCNSQQCDAPVDCEVGSWTEWSECTADCDGGQSTRTREIVTHGSHSGKQCQLALKEVRGCNTDKCHNSVDCVWGEWTDFSVCTRRCGGGHKTRERALKVAPRGDGKKCDPLSKSEVVPCNTMECAENCVDGQWGKWMEWSECSATCGDSYRYRSRHVAVSATSCGKGIEGRSQEFEKCQLGECTANNVDCKFSAWGEWGDCSCTCGGVQDRSRRIVQFAQSGGKRCVGPLRMVGPCNGSCDHTKPVDCQLSAWSEWGNGGTCSAKCGGGNWQRKRTVEVFPVNGGKACEGNLEEVSACNQHACVKQSDCQWGQWGQWGTCTRECGIGERMRYRQIVQEPKNGGLPCAAKDSAEVASCNEKPCNEQKYCAWGAWATWGECSNTCGSGVVRRERYLERSLAPPQIAADILTVNSFAELHEHMNHTEDMYLGSFVAGALLSSLVAFVIARRRNRANMMLRADDELHLLDSSE